MTPNLFEIVKDRGPGEMDLVRSFLTYRLMLSQQIPVDIEIGPWQEEGFLYVSGLQHMEQLNRYRFWGQLFITFSDQEDHPRNRFEVEGQYDYRKRQGSFSIDPLTANRLVYVYAHEPERSGFFASSGQYGADLSDYLLEEIKVRHWVWEEPNNMRYFYEHLEFPSLESSLIDPSLGFWRPICEIRVTGDKEDPELEVTNL